MVAVTDLGPLFKLHPTLEHFSRSIEEALEMAANSILWFLFLRHLGARRGELHVRFRE